MSSTSHEAVRASPLRRQTAARQWVAAAFLFGVLLAGDAWAEGRLPAIALPAADMLQLVQAAPPSTKSGPASVLKKEPAMGQLRENQRVLVDDGSCPAGQIKEVIGGNHTTVGGSKQLVRQRRCIPR